MKYTSPVTCRKITKIAKVSRRCLCGLRGPCRITLANTFCRYIKSLVPEHSYLVKLLNNNDYFSKHILYGYSNYRNVTKFRYLINPFPNDAILDSFKLKEFADDNFKFDEKDRKFSKRVDNIVGKGEIARYEQFLLFPQCFQRTCSADT